MTETTAPKKKKRKYYRSPLDKLVSNSGFTAKAIAAKMGITYDRMVALRRIKEITKTDLELCKSAINGLTLGDDTPLQELPVKSAQNSFNGDSVEQSDDAIEDIPEGVKFWSQVSDAEINGMLGRIKEAISRTEFRAPSMNTEMTIEQRLASTSLVLGKCFAILDGLARLLRADKQLGELTAHHIDEVRRDINRLFYS